MIQPSEEAIGEAHEVFVVGIRGGEVPRGIWAALDAAIRAAYRVDFGAAPTQEERP